MVTVTDYAIRNNSEGESFVALKLQGDLELVQSNGTGRFYATARTTSISSTFTDDVAKALIGKQIPGSIIKVECEPYEYAIPESGEVITLSHRYEYSKEEQTVVSMMQHKVQPLAPNLGVFSTNGKHQVAEA